MDPRGHGQSAMNATEDGHKSELYANDFKAVLDAFKVEKPVFAAWYVVVCHFPQYLD